MKITFVVVLALFLAGFAGIAFGAQDTTVVEDNAPIHLDPRKDSEIIEYIPVGTEVRISSFPLPGGWYKVRSKTGIYGWVSETYLSTQKPKTEKGVTEDLSVIKPERDRRFYIRGFGGFNFFRPDDLNDIFGFDELNTGNYAGGEIGWFISNRITVSLRSEVIWKDVVAQERITGTVYNLSLRSYPVMGGLDFYFLKLPSARVSLGLFAGAGLSTMFMTEAFNLSAPNTVVMESHPFASMARINITRPLGRIVSIFAEGGYRYLKTTELSTANNVSGGRVFLKDAVFRPRAIDLSGPILGLGLALHF